MPQSIDRQTILVSGATGRQGGAAARHLLSRGFRVRALTRKPDQPAARALADAGVEIVEGNLDDRASLDRAMAGVYGAFGVQNFYETGFDGEIRQGKAFADAAKAAGVSHLVYSSVGGAERATGIPHFESKWRIERHIQSIDLPATILRPTAFMENWLASKPAILAGQLPSPLSPDTRLQQIALDDIGAFVAMALADSKTWIGRAVELAGDELSMTETAAAFGRVLGREVRYVRLPWDVFEQRAGKELATMFHWFEDRGYEADIPALRRLHPPLSDFETYLRAGDW